MVELKSTGPLSGFSARTMFATISIGLGIFAVEGFPPGKNH